MPDGRRITEADADFRRLHAQVERVLWQGLRAYDRALRTGPASEHQRAASIFIAHQTRALQLGYAAGHWEGERDYWHAFSAKHSVQAHSALSQRHGVAPDVQRMRRALMFYGASSITKMAREGVDAWQADQRAKIVTAPAKSEAKPAQPTKHLSERSDSLRLDDAANSAMDAWLGGLTARVRLSADVAWTGMQDGYLAAGTIDPANPYSVVWWQLEPSAQHCIDCPSLAADSPYTAPGAGGNELPQTPGDGGTACGGACKCTLQYGSSLLAPMDWTGQGAPTAPAEARQASGQPDEADEWEQNRQRQIADALAAMGQRAPSTQPMPDAPDAWEIERQRQIAEALRTQPGLAYPAPNADDWSRNYWRQIREATGNADPWKQIADALDKSAAPPPTVNGSLPWQRIADALMASAPISEDEAKRQMATPPLDGQLNEDQKKALDLYRKAALAWDKVRGNLPPLDLFTADQDWQDVNFDHLTPEQRAAYALYIEALRAWADATPLDE